MVRRGLPEVFSTRHHGGHIGVPNNGTAAILVKQTNPVGLELFTYVKTSLFQEICIATDRLSESDLLYIMCKFSIFTLILLGLLISQFIYSAFYLLPFFLEGISSKCMFTVDPRCYRCDEIILC